MPFLDWVNKAQAVSVAGDVPYHLLSFESEAESFSVFNSSNPSGVFFTVFAMWRRVLCVRLVSSCA